MTDNSPPIGDSRTPDTPRGGPPPRLLRRDGLAGLLVGLIHVCLFLMLVFSAHTDDRFGRRGAIETFIDLSKLQTLNAPPIQLIQPEVPSNAPPSFYTAPITLPPPLPVPDQKTPAAPGDVLRAIGEALACGANNFEYLTQAERNACRHEPWIARRLPNGTIVLDAAPRIPQAQERISGAEATRRQMQIARPCPIIQNIPCLDDVITGNNTKPF